MTLCSSVYLVDVLSNNVPPPDPIFPVISLPAHISRGIPLAQSHPSGKAANSVKRRSSVTVSTEVDVDNIRSVDDLRDAFLAVEPGSPAAEELVEGLVSHIVRVSKLKGQSQGTTLQTIAVALWKARQGSSL